MLDAWRAISSGRWWLSNGMTRPQALPLSWATVEQYAEAMAMDHEARAILHRVIRGLDQDWLEEHQRQMAAER